MWYSAMAVVVVVVGCDDDDGGRNGLMFGPASVSTTNIRMSVW